MRPAGPKHPTALGVLFAVRFQGLRNRVFDLKRDSAAKVFVVTMGLLNVLGLGLWISYRSFEFIEGFRAFGPDLNSKMISLLFFALLFLVVVSTVIIAYTTLFLARETAFFFQHPLRPQTILAAKLTEALALSSWASLFLCFPVLVSFGILRSAPPLYYLEAAAILAAFLLFAGMVGTALTFVLAPILRRMSPRRLLGLGAVLLAVLGWVFLRSFDLFDMDGENNLLILDRFTTRFALLHHPFSPSRWASAAVLAASAGNHGETLFHTALLAANTLIFFPLLIWYGRRLYGREWLARQSAGPETAGQAKRGRGLVRSRLLARSPVAALIWKDLFTFLRDPAQLSQSLLFLLLMVIYALSLMEVPDSLVRGPLRQFVFFSTIGALAMVLSSFTSRFLFPLISLEGRAFWIVGLAPIPRSHLLRQKFLYGLGVSLLLGLPVGAASLAALGVPPLQFATGLYTLVLASVCLTALATGLGAAYPSFDEDNPARIAIGLGGTLNFFASAFSVALILFLEALPYLTLGNEPPLAAVLVGHALALVYTVSTSFFALRLGGRALARCEF